jgi:hypothetical protein
MLLAVLAAGCGGAPPAPEAPPETPAAPEAPPEDVMENVQLELWPSTDTPGQDVKPLLLIRAARVTGSGGETKSLSFEGAEATVPAAAPGATELQFTAQHGAFEEGVRAVLDQGVVARVNDMIIELESITWEVAGAGGEAGAEAGGGGGGIAYSDRPLKITSPTQRLEAASLRLDVATETIELRQVTGEITFSGETP